MVSRFIFKAQSGSTYSIQATNNGDLIAVQENGELQATVLASGSVPKTALFYITAA